MARISDEDRYPVKVIPAYSDIIIGTDHGTGITNNFRLRDILAEVGAIGIFVPKGGYEGTGQDLFDLIPLNTSELINNGSDGSSPYVEGDQLAVVATTGSYNDLLNIPTIAEMVYPSSGIPISTGTSWGVSIADNSTNWDTAYANRITNTSVPLIFSGNTLSITQASGTTHGYLLSNDWNTFNNKQPAGDYITSLTGEVTASGAGAATAVLSTPAVTGKLLVGLNVAGGSISASDSILTAMGKIQSQINSVLGGAIFQTTWNASINSPTLTSSSGTKGHYYIVDVLGSTNLDGITDWKVGDWVIYDGAVWRKVDNTDAVSSVNGLTGAVSLTTSDITEGSRLYYTESRVSLNTDVAANTAARHSAVTLGTTNGLGLVGQQISLGLSSSTTIGALSSTDWNTFNSKQPALGYTAVPDTRVINTTSPLLGGGNLTADRTLSIQQSSSTLSGFLSSTDWNTFNNKAPSTGGTGYIQNQNVSAQSANMWVTGGIKTNSDIDLNRSGLTSSAPIRFSTNGTNDWFVGQSPLGTSTKNLSFYSYGTNSVIFDLNQTNGAATFASSVTTGDDVFIPAGKSLKYNSTAYITPEDNIQGARIKTMGGIVLESAGVTSTSTISASNGTLIGGTLTSGYIPKATGVNSLGNSDMTSTTGDLTTPSTLNLGSTFNNGADAFDKLKVYLFKGATESYGFGLGGVGDMQYWAGSSSTGIHKFFTSQTERMRITSSGNVGIGTTSPTIPFGSGLHIQNSTAAYLKLSYTGNVGFDLFQSGLDSYIYNRDNGGLFFGTNNAEKMRITSGGNVGIGTTSPASKLHIEGDGSSTTDETVLTLKGNGENGKRIDFRNAFGSLARITGTKLAGGPSADEGILTFETATDSVLSEKMRITSGGNVLIGTTTDGGVKLRVNKSEAGATPTEILRLENTGSGYTSTLTLTDGVTNDGIISYVGSTQSLRLRVGASGLTLSSVGVAKIDNLAGTGSRIVVADASGNLSAPTNFTHTGNATITGTVTASGGFFNSDLRLKNIIKRDGDVAYFTWKDGRDTRQHIGYVAQEVQKTHPDQVQADDKGVLSVNYVEILVEKIRLLEKRLEILEGGKNGI